MSIPTRWPTSGRCARLAGVWQSGKGVDLNPKAEGPERRDYIERIEMQPIDPQANGPQLLLRPALSHPHQHAEEEITFHDQVGYWLWEPATGLVLQTLTIPRGQVALAVGHAQAGRQQIVGERRRAARPSTASARPTSWNTRSAPTPIASRSPSTTTAAGAMSPTRCWTVRGRRRALPAPRPEHAGEDRRTQAQSAVPDRAGPRLEIVSRGCIQPGHRRLPSIEQGRISAVRTKGCDDD